MSSVLFYKSFVFSLDGDSIILASNHNLVVKVQNARGKNRTPLVLGRRDLADAEFWTFTATDGSDSRPTSGFVHVPQERDHRTLAYQLANALKGAQPGTVIEIDQDIDLTGQPQLGIPAGVTIRGDRRGTRFGPELFMNSAPDQTMFEIIGSEVRITGLRMRGPSRSTDEDTSKDAKGILFNTDKLLLKGSIIDHNDMSDWPLAAVDVQGRDLSKDCQAGDDNPGSGQENVRIVRNFLHHNQRQNLGYGVGTGSGGYSFIDGNTFVSNRHAIAASGEARTIYRAWYNLVLQDAPLQYIIHHIPIIGIGIHRGYSHDFDMHGTDDPWYFPAGYGGTGGQYVEIAWNTFLGTGLGRTNFDLRGEPCYLADFYHNVSLLGYNEKDKGGDAVDCTLCGGGINKLRVHDNQFDSANPTNRLGVGDFDGDGKDDLFLATGAAWYYAPAGNAEWRFINGGKTDKIDSLLFGDFDGDGRTDVMGKNRNDLMVSWGGASGWEKINSTPASVSDLAIGDFDGDGRDDVFYADGSHWYISDGGGGPFTHADTSSTRIADLRFGDFNNDGKTDVFGVGSKDWLVANSGTEHWHPLPSKLTDSVAGLIVADFDGNGQADIAKVDFVRPSPTGTWVWKVSYNGTGNWTPLRTATSLSLASPVAIGRFDDNRSADVLLWQDNYLAISAGGSGVPARQSSQDMR